MDFPGAGGVLAIGIGGGGDCVGALAVADHARTRGRRAVAGADSLEDAEAILAGRGIRSELAYERDP